MVRSADLVELKTADDWTQAVSKLNHNFDQLVKPYTTKGEDMGARELIENVNANIVGIEAEITNIKASITAINSDIALIETQIDDLEKSQLLKLTTTVTSLSPFTVNIAGVNTPATAIGTDYGVGDFVIVVGTENDWTVFGVLGIL